VIIICSVDSGRSISLLSAFLVSGSSQLWWDLAGNNMDPGPGLQR
jgi:hypothetical protein